SDLRDEFVDRGVDRRILSADAGTGEEADEEEVPGGEGERCGHRGHQVEDQSDDEQLAAPEAVGELAEDDRADAGTEDVDRAGGADVGGTHLDAAAVFGQACGDVADHRDFEAVEDPYAAETDDD